MELTEKQWQLLEPVLPELLTRRRGRPWRKHREVLDAVLWILRTGAPWRDLPKQYPPYQTCHRRFQQGFSEMPAILIGDKAYDSDPLDASLRQRGIEMVAPHKKNRKRRATQEGRRLHRCKRRFQVERFFSWIEAFRRLVVRWEYHAVNYLGFVHLACLRMLLKYL